MEDALEAAALPTLVLGCAPRVWPLSPQHRLSHRDEFDSTAFHYSQQALHMLMMKLAAEVKKGTRGLDASLVRHVSIDAQTAAEFLLVFSSVPFELQHLKRVANPTQVSTYLGNRRVLKTHIMYVHVQDLQRLGAVRRHRDLLRGEARPGHFQKRPRHPLCTAEDWEQLRVVAPRLEPPQDIGSKPAPPHSRNSARLTIVCET
jgi:hypothetical protein